MLGRTNSLLLSPTQPAELPTPDPTSSLRDLTSTAFYIDGCLHAFVHTLGKCVTPKQEYIKDLLCTLGPSDEGYLV